MPRDPICGQYVDEKTPFKTESGGETRYFCSEECMEEYQFEMEDQEFMEPAGRTPEDED